MIAALKERIWTKVIEWLTEENTSESPYLSDFERLSYEIRPGDVLLVEGRSRVAEIIKIITLSSWTHAAMYIGRLYDIKDPEVRAYILTHYDGPEDEQLVFEALLGKGAIVAPLSQFKNFHLRICRPKGLSPKDAQHVIAHVANKIGNDYNIRELLDLGRFVFPYAFLPRRWRSSLFEHNAGQATRAVCSSMLAEGFASVRFPILPLLKHDAKGRITIHRRNHRLFTPRDFDYSPYFNIIKYPFYDFDELAVYRDLPWDKRGIPHNDSGDVTVRRHTESESETKLETEENPTDKTNNNTISDDSNVEDDTDSLLQKAKNVVVKLRS